MRSGFVSNSSSSSFIVGFNHMPTSPEALEKEMFGKPCKVNYYDSDETDSIEIARTVFNEIQSGVAKKLTKKSAINVLLEGYFPGKPPYRFNNHDDSESEKIRRSYKEETGKNIYDEFADKKIQKLYRKIQRKEQKQSSDLTKMTAKAFLEGFWPQLKGKKVFRFEYADESGQGVYEHGDIFRSFPHVRIDKH